jgi:hypothetical protein
MQASDFGNRNHGTHLRGHDGPAVRRVLVERQVRPSAVIVHEVPSPHAAPVALAEHDQMVETLASDGADEPFHEGILPRTPGAVRTSSMPKPFTRRRQGSPKIRLRSRSRYAGAVSSGKASTICCAVQAAVGCSVMLKCTTRRR